MTRRHHAVTNVILRTALAAIVVFAVILYTRAKSKVPDFCVALIAASLVGQVLIARKGNLYPICRVWLISGTMAAIMYPIDSLSMRPLETPTGYSYFAGFFGGLVAGLWSMAEGRSFWSSRCHFTEPDKP